MQDTKSDVKCVVLTGGSGSGKTTMLNSLRECDLGKNIVFIPEVANWLFGIGFPMPGRDVEWSREWQYLFEDANFRTQLFFERIYRDVALSRSITLVVCDRGLMDCAAYLPGGVSEFCKRYDVDLEETLNRYSKVIHLESLATVDPEQYLCLYADDQRHWHPLEDAQALETRTRAVWQGHPGWLFVSGGEGLAKSESIVHAVIRDFVASSRDYDGRDDCE